MTDDAVPSRPPIGDPYASPWVLASRVLPNGLVVEIQPLTYGRARLTTRPVGEPGLLDGW